MDPRTEIRAEVTKVLAEREGVAVVSDSERLVTTGRLTSLEVVQLGVFLEKAFQVDFTRCPFSKYDFESVDRMVDLVRRSRGA
jgi:acyl carrier protein